MFDYLTRFGFSGESFHLEAASLKASLWSMPGFSFLIFASSVLTKLLYGVAFFLPPVVAMYEYEGDERLYA